VSMLPATTAISDSNAVEAVNFRIVGRTGDLQNYTAFLRRLEESPWLTNVLPVEAKTVVEGNRALTAFTIQASYVRADSSHIRTVPVIESVVR
jgi:Tfp pilus assembly protein PilN